MTAVEEHWSTFPFDEPPQSWKREEELLLAPHLPSRKVVRDAPLQVVHFPPQYEPTKMGHPRPVYESRYLRLEWQTMPDSRQPFYHRNTDVDELSLQVSGERSLVTDRGTVEMRTGDYVSMPTGTAHDNYGRGDIHVLFYTPAGVEELGPVDRRSEVVIPPSTWEPTVVNELVTECLGGPEHDIVMYPANEIDIWENALRTEARLNVIRTDPDARGTTWLYRSENIMIGETHLVEEPGLDYIVHRNCEEIQYQISGERLLVSQRGMVRIQPGDFVKIPIGVAFTSIVREESKHVRVCSATAYLQQIEGQECVRAFVPQIAETTSEAVPVDLDVIAAERNGW
ncbi:hypothetical protein [Microbacterium sp. 22242]|uniref:hypothetical protein n=1 Tax=Microbacterium sp. 22242 TaxID=3453896 RepID=UPI003F8716A1